MTFLDYVSMRLFFLSEIISYKGYEHNLLALGKLPF